MNYWDVHDTAGGLVFLICLAVFPRITLGFLSIITGAIGITFWGAVGWLFVPRIVVAIIATTIYWHTNPVLCIFAWIVALAGEGGEKAAVGSNGN